MAHNIRMLKKLERHMRRIRHEEHYDQGTWGTKTACGTAACLAGHAVLMLPKARLIYDNPTWPNSAERVRYQQENGTMVSESIEPVAARTLGLDYDEADVLFDGDPGQRWPKEFADRFVAAANDKTERPSRVAADLLKAVIEGEVDLVADQQGGEDDEDYYDDGDDD